MSKWELEQPPNFGFRLWVRGFFIGNCHLKDHSTIRQCLTSKF